MRRCSHLLLLRPQAWRGTAPSAWALTCTQQRHIANGSSLDLAAGPTYTIWGANTGVGKTLASMGLARAARHLQAPLLYLKPVQTGFPTDSDARAVALACGLAESAGPHAAQLLAASSRAAASAPSASISAVKVLYAWSRACGPHEAMANEGRAVADAEVLSSVVSELGAFKARLSAAATMGSAGQPAQALALVETAGGVASPAPSGDLQCDLLRPLRLPCILVGDARLGGISATISAYESLTLRGHDVDFIVLLEPPVSPVSPGLPGAVPGSGTSLNNGAAIQRHLGSAVHRLGMRTRVMTFPGCAAPTPDEVAAANGGLDAAVKAWLDHTQHHFTDLVQSLMQHHTTRRSRLAAMADQASSQIWWPFTQHASLAPGSVQVIDSRCGEHWQVLGQDQKSGSGAGSRDSQASVSAYDRLTTVYDACSSWWTQAVPARWHPEVAQAVAYAAGRYMHVMFPENAHEPAVLLADRLLSTVGSGWASRVFYSDDGSTAVEVALKMAFRKYLHDHGLDNSAAAATTATTTTGATAASHPVPELQVLGLHNAYHGDTLGAMDCVAPSVYNGPLQAAWYRGRGLFLQPPYVALVKGRWTITDPPSWLQQQWQSKERGGREAGWGSLDEVLSESRDGSELTHIYRQYIEAEIQQHTSAGRGRLAATILEPLLQGAGGMLLVDPQFQRAMVQVCRDRNIPVIFDEVMTGVYRLGALSGAQLLRCQPDLACYAKILTAGVVPMAVTLTSSAVFDAFQGPSKLQALLHGHSYTAYPVGCAAALAALDILCNPKSNPNLCAPSQAADAAAGGIDTQPSAGLASVTTQLPAAQSSSCCKAATACQAACVAPCGRLLALWDDQQVTRLSHHAAVSRVVAVGTLVAVEVNVSGTANCTAGYAAGGAAVQVARQLLHKHSIFCRPLGPVVYLMVPPATDRRRCQQLLECLEQELDAVAAAGKDGASSSEEGVVV